MSLFLLFISLALSAGAQAGIIDELSPQQQQDVLAGKTVLITKDIDGAPWPEMHLYHIVHSTAEQAMAVNFDYELRTKYTPELTYAKIANVIDPKTTDVDYTLRLPILGPEKFTLEHQISTYDSGYRMDWHLVRADRTKKSEGYSRIETLGNEAIFAVVSFIDPGNPLARVIKSQAIQQSEQAAQGFADQIELEVNSQQDLLQSEVAKLRAAFGASRNPASDPQQSKKIELTIFHTNDLHSRLRAAKNDPFGLGGLARIKTLLNSLRAKAPGSITLDAGDWSEGAWYYNIDEGTNMLRFLDEMGFDATCVGNHDFLAGPDQLVKSVKDASPRLSVLAANLDVTNFPRAKEFADTVPAQTVLQAQGLKIGVIGLSIQPGQYDTFIAPVKLEDPISAVLPVAAALRPNVDVLLIVSHNDFTYNKRIAREVPGVDAVISGHTHLKTPRAVLQDNVDGRRVPVVETGFWGKFVGELKLEVNTGVSIGIQGPVRMKSYELHPVTPDIPEDPQMAAEILEQDRLLNEKYGFDVNQVVGDSDYDIDQSDYRETTLGNLVAKSYRDATGADAALEATSFTGAGIASGPVTIMDLHDTVPHTYDPSTGKEWTIHIWNASGKDIQTVFNAFLILSGLMPTTSPYGWVSTDNIDYLWTPVIGTLGHDVHDIRIDGAPLDLNKRYRIALSNGFLRGMQIANEKVPFLNLDLSDIQDTGIEAWRSVLAYGTRPGSLALSNLRIGRNAKTSGPDLAIFPYDLSSVSGKLRVAVENVGDTPSSESSVECSTGISGSNGLVPFNTDAQKWTIVGRATLVPLPAGETHSLEFPWDQSRLEGYWPVRCRVEHGGRYHPNDNATKVFRFGHN